MRFALFILLITLAAACQEQEGINPEIQDLPQDAEGLEKLLNTDPDHHTKLEIYWQLYKAYRDSDPSTALNHLDQQVALAEGMEEYVYLGKAYFGKGLTYKKMEKYLKAVDNYISAVTAFEKSNEPERIASVLNNLGVVFMQTGNYEYAERFCERALSIYEASDDTVRQVIININLGICNFSKKDPEHLKADTYLDKALCLNGAANEKQDFHFNRIYNQLGINNYKRGNYQAAVDNYLLSLQYIDQDEDANDKKVIAYANIGEALIDGGEYLEAQKWLNKATELSGFIKTKNNLIIYNILAKLYQQQNDHQQSVEYLEKAIEIANQDAINQHLQETLELIRVSYRVLNQAGKPVSSHRYDNVLEVDGRQDALEKELVEKTNFEALQTALTMTIELSKEKQQKEAEAVLKTFYIKVALALLLLAIGITVFLRYRTRRIQQKHENFKDELFGKVERFLHTMES